MNNNQIRARALRQIALSLVERLKDFEESLNSEEDLDPCDDCLLTYNKLHETCRACCKSPPNLEKDKSSSYGPHLTYYIEGLCGHTKQVSSNA